MRLCIEEIPSSFNIKSINVEASVPLWRLIENTGFRFVVYIETCIFEYKGKVRRK